VIEGHKTRRQRVRPWLPAGVLFAAGFAGRLVVEAAGGDPQVTAMYAITFQTWAYGAGLLVLAGWWLRSADVGVRGAFGCMGWLALAMLSAALVVSSSHH
jgi:hypothetical protein